MNHVSAYLYVVLLPPPTYLNHNNEVCIYPFVFPRCYSLLQSSFISFGNAREPLLRRFYECSANMCCERRDT